MNLPTISSGMIPGAGAAGTAMMAEQVRLEVISQNIANARTTRTAAGGPYQRQQVRFLEAMRQAEVSGGGAVAPRWEIVRDPRPPVLVLQEGHPDADANGMVAFPAVNIHEEMADLMLASRAYEANLAVIRNGRALAQQALTIGKR